MSKTLTSGLLLVPLALATAGYAQDEGKQTAKMSFKAFKKWSFILPQENWTDANGGLPIKHPNGSKFHAFREGVKLMVDVDGDGDTDKPVKGTKGFLKLKSKADGKTFEYAVRFKGGNGKYKFCTAGAMVGNIADSTIRLIDANHNGMYNDLGADAMIVGKGAKAASLLSSVVNLNGSLYNLEVAEDGSEISVTPYDGETGTLNLASGYKGSAKLMSAVVKNGDMSFNLAGKGKGLLVPVGDYSLAGGMVKKGKHTARMKNGHMAPIEVKAGGTSKLRWGNRVISEFSHSAAGREVKIEPSAVKFYGYAGEEYTDFAPNVKSPRFFVYNVRGKELGSNIYGA